MKLEIKNISLRSVIFSVYPLIVFAISLLNAVFAAEAIGEYGIMERVMQVVLWSLAETMVILVTTLVVAFVYNLLCSFGVKGLRFEIEEVEDNKQQQDGQNAQAQKSQACKTFLSGAPHSSPPLINDSLLSA